MTQANEPLTSGVLKIERIFSSKIEDVFSAFTDPAKMSLWFFGYPGGSAKIEQDLKLGGHYRIEMIHPSKSLEDSKEACDSPVHYGKYLEIDPPKRLAFTWINDNFVEYSEVTIDFSETDDGTKIILTHKLPSDKISLHEEGWNACFENLALLYSRC